MPYLNEVLAERNINPKLLATEEGRRYITKEDPLLFAAVYMPHKLKAPGSDAPISFCQFHLEVIEYALSLIHI